MKDTDVAYALARAKVERQLAEQAPHSKARQAHMKLALEYEARATGQNIDKNTDDAKSG